MSRAVVGGRKVLTAIDREGKAQNAASEACGFGRWEVLDGGGGGWGREGVGGWCLRWAENSLSNVLSDDDG